MRLKLLFCILPFCFLFGCMPNVANIGHRNEASSLYTKSFKINEPIRLSISGENINLEIYTWDKDEIKIEAIKRISGNLDKDDLAAKLDGFYLNAKQEGNTISLLSGYKGSQKNISKKIVDLRIFTRKDISDLQFEIAAGTIKILDDIGCRLSGTLGEVNTEINKFDGTVNLKVDMGNIRISNGEIKGDSSITTDMGNIDIKSEFDENGSYRFATKVGSIEMLVHEKSRVSFLCTGAVSINQFENENYQCKIKVGSEIGSITIKKYKEF